MDNMNIRPVTKNDIPQLLDLMCQYIVDFYKRPRPSKDSLSNLVNNLIDNPREGLQFVAEKDNELIGFATLYFTYSTLNVKRQAILNDLFVIPEMRRKKIGERLFLTCLSYIRENNFVGMVWETAKDNYVAQSLYKKMGGIQSEWIHYEIN
ncbi:GNAT family N-acetyltransferase [Parageobacillus thermoglucosidasius]|uniref:GCN5-related N-acetyltransferase n=1 Tax=Geobacillus sp. (strain Y4.1MC1) TaxID=581103 RepID=A0A7U3YIQ9_GEOS0|nr:GNAT family N-acetyltransferase [Parageobacillus thermoglucosidasius]MED4905389.1 GNAT family N-acetyltransferase [Parageobacillus thermoglucosidasius]MED4913788.1 GNAT family N-acetyltransferase [Parageobacillus thermoglucosidasius]MED4946144.1 GNAT family N-acetyltransferase [Parageobacillus thermoglucosidasius]MED4983998.1 GNAT family N-acetyltransferase [Parageobacillus thermoglucosidasius]RDE30467.1 GNAT family N-acetyltransferase [Parageobacillus thermoglucosidasius]